MRWNAERHLPEGLPATLAGVAEHMKADALARVLTHGADDPMAAWLWSLAESIEDKRPEDLAVHPPGWRKRGTPRPHLRIPQQRKPTE